MSTQPETSNVVNGPGAAQRRLLLVSNRLPVKIELGEEGVHLVPSAGGLATALGRMHDARGGNWVGWPGGEVHPGTSDGDEILRQLADRRLVPVTLEPELEDGFYRRFSNSILWPLFHYLVNRVEVDNAAWASYREANDRFADAVAEVWRDGDLIWIQDYHLMLLPRLLRERLPDASIGFFLHTPFPSSEIFSILPWRRELLSGVLGADLIGFHVFDYLRHFRSTARRVLGVDAENEILAVDGRSVQLGVFPIGIDPEKFSSTAEQDPESLAELEALRSQLGQRRLILGVDRMDYTKGIPERLLGYERFLELYPDHHGRVEMLQVGVPSRTGVESYQELKRQVDGIVGRVNGRFGSADWTPIKYVYRSVPFPQLCAMYRHAAVALITPLRDGMNLVAKEYVACQVDRDGVLVLSEFAGAASDLTEALLVNPYNPDAVARELERALTMDEGERRARMEQLQQRVWRGPIGRWGQRFVRRLEEAAQPEGRPYPPRLRRERRAALLEAWTAARRRTLVLDYDGTLRAFVDRPERADPEPELIDLLNALGARTDVSLAIVSGRDTSTLERWLGRLPAALVAEHGRWLRTRDGEWEDVLGGVPPWLEWMTDLLEEFADSTPGSLVEVKSGSVAWHYRTANQEMADRAARELERRLQEVRVDPPHDVLRGNKVIEVRVAGITKGTALLSLLGRMPGADLLMVAGDDATDEEMFAQLPPSAWSIHVGSRRSKARVSLPGPSDLIALLRDLHDALPR